MGIDFVVESTIVPDIYKGTQDSFLKWAWKDIEWRAIFNLLNINLGALYDNAISYWSVDQVVEMHQLIKKFYECPTDVLYDDDERELKKQLIRAIELRHDTHKLLDFFEDYVKNKAIICVF